jgi:hypothetical protein
MLGAIMKLCKGAALKGEDFFWTPLGNYAEGAALIKPIMTCIHAQSSEYIL